MIDQLLEGNKKFRETVFKQNIDHYKELAKGQSPPVLWICLLYTSDAADE